jgi:hypothetical protein
MKKTFQHFFITSSALLILLAAVGCDEGPDNTRPAYDQYRFDEKVIAKLPAYDSLASAILKELSLLRSLNGSDSQQAFRYSPSSTESEVFKRLPPGVGTDIDRLFNQLGPNFILGFDAFHDSTIKIYVRTLPPDTSKVNIEEHLSYYPAGAKMKQREFPFKDSVLNEHWQYWVRFSKQTLF